MRNRQGQFLKKNHEENYPLVNLLGFLWSLMNYFILMLFYLPWICTFLFVIYVIYNMIDPKVILESVKENYVCQCNSKLNGKNTSI